MDFVDVTMPLGRTVRLMPHVAVSRASEEHERKRLVALQRLLRPHDVVYDVGAEEGVFTVLAAQIVGADNVHIFEPAPGVWPNIRAHWQANELAETPGCWQGFVGDSTIPPTALDDLGIKHHRYGRIRAWPTASEGPLQLTPAYVRLGERPEIPSTSIDDYVARTDCPPDLIMVDIEGAEGVAMKGMRRTLIEHRPTVFMTVHPWFMFTPFLPSGDVPGAYDVPSQEYVFRTFALHLYRSIFLGLDHEPHWLFIPQEKEEWTRERLRA